MNIKAILRHADLIERLPPDEFCMTSCPKCIMGHLAVPDYRSDSRGGHDIIMEELGVTEEMADAIAFHSDGMCASQSDAVDMLRRLAETGRVEWRTAT